MMAKRVWNIIGRNFAHTSGEHTGRCGTHGKLPDKIEWSFTYESDLSFYLDQNLFLGKEDRNDLRKFGWLLESKSIKPRTTEEVKLSYNELLDTYEIIFTHNKELLALDPRFKFTICCGYWVKDVGIHPKSKLVSAISSGKRMCEGHHWRNQFIEQNRGNFDLFGNSYKHIRYKEMGLRDYMFSVAIENGSYATYFTEKILDCFATGTIPIYRGSPDIGDFFNEDGIILIDDRFTFDQLTPDLYYSKMDAIRDNHQRLHSYHCAEDFIYTNYHKQFNLGI